MAINNKVLVLLLILSFGVAIEEASSQTNRRRRTNRSRPAQTVARPPVSPPVPTLEPEVISTAEDEQNSDETANTLNPDVNSATGTAKKPSKTSERVSELSKQVGELNEKIGSLDKQQRNLLELERLTRAEERSQNIHRQLDEMIEKEAALQLKVDELNIMMQPQNIERETAVIGSLRPEEVRENRRKVLDAEKKRTVELLTKMSESRVKLEAAAANADALVEQLRASVEAQTTNDKLPQQNTTPPTDTQNNSEPPLNDNPL